MATNLKSLVLNAAMTLLATNIFLLPGNCAPPSAPARQTSVSPGYSFQSTNRSLPVPEAGYVLVLASSQTNVSSLNQELKVLGFPANSVQSYDLSSISMKLLKISIGSRGLAKALGILCLGKPLGIQRNWQYDWSQIQVVAMNQSASPSLANQAYLRSMNLVSYWSTVKQRSYIAFLDSGIPTGGLLSRKIAQGVSATGGLCAADDVPPYGHGSIVTSVCLAGDPSADLAYWTGKGQVTPGATPSPSVGANPWGLAYPIDISRGGGAGTDSLHLVLGLDKLMQTGVRIAVLGVAPQSGAWSLLSDPLAQMMLRIYYSRGGLVFAPAGNSATNLGSAKPDSALILVSAANQLPGGGTLAFSNYGYPVWFAAPGQYIYATTTNGTQVVVNGTSPACALVAGLASMILSNNPGLTNAQLLTQLARYATGTPMSGSTYGTPVAPAH